MTLLRRTLEFSRNDSSTFLPLTFAVPSGCPGLEIRMRYAPLGGFDRAENLAAIRAEVADYVSGTDFDVPGAVDRLMALRNLDVSAERIRNQINLILYDPSGAAVGRWDLGHLPEPPPVHVSPRAASPGFAPHPCEPGTWSAVVEVWQVHTPQVEVFLEIRSAPLPETGLPTKAEKGRRALPRRIARPRVPGILFGEMHSHSVHSDGKYPVDELGQRAEFLGLDFVALTDHNTTSGHKTIGNSPVIFLRGEELTTFFGHFCVYGLDRCLDWHDAGGNARAEQAMVRARAAGWLTSLAHPNCLGGALCVGCRFRVGSVAFERFDLMEVWSGAWRLRHPEIVKSLVLWDRLMDQGIPLVGLAGRDWHGPAQEDTPDTSFPVTAVLTADRHENGILGAIRAGRVFLTSGPIVQVRVEDDTGWIGLGESLRVSEGETCRLQLDILRPAATPATVFLVRDGRFADSRQLPRRLTNRWELRLSAPGRYRVEIWSDDGELLAVTNHWWIVSG